MWVCHITGTPGCSTPTYTTNTPWDNDFCRAKGVPAPTDGVFPATQRKIQEKKGSRTKQTVMSESTFISCVDERWHLATFQQMSCKMLRHTGVVQHRNIGNSDAKDRCFGKRNAHNPTNSDAKDGCFGKRNAHNPTKSNAKDGCFRKTKCTQPDKIKC